MKPWSNKRKRIVIGILMMSSFIDIVFATSFITAISNALNINVLFALVSLQYCWLPAVFYIFLSYHVLTKIYKFEDKNGRLENDKLQELQKS